LESPSLAIDATGWGHVAFENWNCGPAQGGNKLLWGYFDANQEYPSLATEIVDQLAVGRCAFPAIALDYLSPHIVYSRPPTDDQGVPDEIYHAERGNPWITFNVSSTQSVTSTHSHIAIHESILQVVWSEGGGEILHRARDPWFWWGPITDVSNTTGESDYPRIVMPGYHVTWMDKTESLTEGGGPPRIWQSYYTIPSDEPGLWKPAVNLVPTVEHARYPHAVRRQDLIGNTFFDVAHTEGDPPASGEPIYTIEISHKQVSGGGSGGEMLLAVNVNESAPGGSRALWKRMSFSVPRDLDVSFAIAGLADNQDEMKLVLDSRDFGWNTPEAWKGSELRGQSKVVRFRGALKAGRHTLELHASGRPVFKGLRAWYGKIGGGPQSDGLSLDVPKATFLSQSFPNPTFGKATIAYGLAKEGPVKLTVFNALGQVVRDLVSESQKPGFHRVEWDGKTRDGKQVSSGIYFYRLNAGGFSKTNKLVVVR
jgi:hypothetical protein